MRKEKKAKIDPQVAYLGRLIVIFALSFAGLPAEVAMGKTPTAFICHGIGFGLSALVCDFTIPLAVKIDTLEPSGTVPRKTIVTMMMFVAIVGCLYSILRAIMA